MAQLEEVTGVILAGGQSSRFGSNKALALWHGKPLIQHVTDALSSVFNDIVLSTNSPADYRFLKIKMIRDLYHDMGPLAGIHAVLHHTGKPWIFVAGCDMPAVTPDLITCLCGYTKEEFEAVLPWLAAGPEPLCGLYHKTALAKIEMQLKIGKVKLKELAEKLSVRKVGETELRKVPGGLLVFSNINRPLDLERL
jgi:molybdopterin-guanine dinucleotide biosynthesis protein A